mgnify:FL=1|jgi:hypothetical protein
MATPNGGLITETNAQYYSGVQAFLASGVDDGTNTTVVTATFNTKLVFGSFDPTIPAYNLNNFKLYTSPNGRPGTYTEYITTYTVVNSVITIPGILAQDTTIVVQLNNVFGGNFGDKDATGDTVEENYGNYQYIAIKDIIDNFLVAYVGAGKLIPSVKTTDIAFHAKRAMQEFSYDTLRSMHSQELTIPKSLSVPLPQDYVNYVNVSWIDVHGVKHIIYPTTLTSNPYNTPIQDNQGIATQDNIGENLEGTSQIEDKWDNNNNSQIQIDLQNNASNLGIANGWFGVLGDQLAYGQRYGMQPELAQFNGWFTINDREGKMSFSSDLVDKLILLEYISDGLSYDQEMQIPKLAEEAIYAYIIHAILATRINQPEYVVQRLKREKSAKLRNAKIRLSNIKLSEFVQVMRGKSKWIKN